MLVVHSGQEIEQDHTGALPIRMIQISRFLLAAPLGHAATRRLMLRRRDREPGVLNHSLRYAMSRLIPAKPPLFRSIQTPSADLPDPLAPATAVL